MWNMERNLFDVWVYDAAATAVSNPRRRKTKTLTDEDAMLQYLLDFGCQRTPEELISILAMA
jgi:hypothetical protein